jgi:16S rRNA (cytidine1402-2'-O)-methyltransferase
MLDVLGDRQMAVARELTNLYEEIYRGRISQGLAYYSTQPMRGEFTLVVGGQEPVEERWHETQLRLSIQESLEKGDSPSKIAADLADLSAWPRRSIYRMVMEICKEDLDEPG